MFNSKYSKVLTIILIVAIVLIIGLLIYIGIDWYKAYSTNADIDEGLGQFDGYVNNVIANNQNDIDQNNTIQNNETNIIEPDIDTNSIIQEPTGENNEEGNGGNSGGNNSSTTTSKPKYKGFYMVGKIEIPKINLKYPVLESVTPKSIEASVGVLYGPGINKVGNTVIIGHNYRNGTFFSNNKKLSEGDKIYLTDLQGKKVTYTIYKKYITGTDDFDYAVRDTKGKREISLSTCTDDSKQRLVIWAKES